MEARKLPSGSWRCRVYSHTEDVLQPDGSIKQKKVYKSFTCDDTSQKGKRKCEKMAAEWAENKESNVRNKDLTFGDALDEYIRLRSSVLSPGTIREYKRSRNADLQGLMNMSIYKITQNDIQKEINKEALSHSPKSVKNMHGLVSAVFDIYRPDFRLKTKLPEKVRPKINIPSENDIKKLLHVVKDTELEIPVLLAAFGPMRRGEICALDSDHIKGNIVHVEYSMTINENNEWVKKRPKSYAGDRYIVFPDFVIDKLKTFDGKVTELNPASVSNRFKRLLKRHNIANFRFHDLRHYSASMLHAMDVPDQYIMQRGGWASDAVLKQVYRHVLEEEAKKQNDRINERFSELYDTKV